jgi:hypothetical protein
MAAQPLTPQRRHLLRDRSRSPVKTIATLDQASRKLWEEAGRVMVLANEARMPCSAHDTFVDMRGREIPALAHNIAGILGMDVIGASMLVLNHRSWEDRVAGLPPSSGSLSRNLRAALGASGGQIVVWCGEYHSRVFDSLQRLHAQGHDFRYQGRLATIQGFPEDIDIDKTIMHALDDGHKLPWHCDEIKTVVAQGALHVAVRVHLSYNTDASERLKIVFPAIFDGFHKLGTASKQPLSQTSHAVLDVNGFIATSPLQRHAADHLRSLREDIQQEVMRGGLGRTRNPTSVLMWRINTAKSRVARPYDVERFLQTHRIEAHVGKIVRRLPAGVQQQLMDVSLTGAREVAIRSPHHYTAKSPFAAPYTVYTRRSRHSQ